LQKKIGGCKITKFGEKTMSEERPENIFAIIFSDFFYEIPVIEKYTVYY
jgi:hypothetical protein